MNIIPTTRLATDAGEHNTRLLAMRDDAAFRKDMLAQLDWSFCDYVRKNGFGELTFNFPGSQMVSVIHARLAGEYAAAHNVVYGEAYKATGVAAFAEWDATNAMREAA